MHQLHLHKKSASDNCSPFPLSLKRNTTSSSPRLLTPPSSSLTHTLCSTWSPFYTFFFLFFYISATPFLSLLSDPITSVNYPINLNFTHLTELLSRYSLLSVWRFLIIFFLVHFHSGSFSPLFKCWLLPHYSVQRKTAKMIHGPRNLP